MITRGSPTFGFAPAGLKFVDLGVSEISVLFGISETFVAFGEDLALIFLGFFLFGGEHSFFRFLLRLFLDLGSRIS